MTVEVPPPTTTSKMTPSAKLDALRAKMKELNLDVYLVPSDDPHLSEIAPAAYARRAFMTGFTGSAGTAVITHDKALLWTDSRYWNQFALQVDDTLWTLMKAGLPKVPKLSKWLATLAVEHYKSTTTPLKVGIDPYVHPASFADEVNKAFEEEALAELPSDCTDTSSSSTTTTTTTIGTLETSHSNLIDPIWGDERPEIPYSPFRVHPMEFAGQSIASKVSKIRSEMKVKKATLAVFCTLDDVAYLFNVRTMGDVECSPVGLAYATISCDNVCLYCDQRKVQSPQVQEHLKDVTIKPYEDIVSDIQQHVVAKQGGDDSATRKVWIDASRASFALRNVIPKKSLIDCQNAITPMKAIKNKLEMEGMRRAHLMDGVAFCKFMVELNKRILQDKQLVSEVEIDRILTGFRAQQPGFYEPSFPTIAGVGSNAAIIHYRATEDNTELLKYLDDKTPILIDSGGQYEYGTTDVTRTIHLGPNHATEEFKNCYTYVLQGHIGIDTMIFPEDTPGCAFDVMARKALWEAGLDYGHGTGHGVGAALNVHEGPHSISPRFYNTEGLKRGMIVSNEPGYYDDGNLGVRIENLVEITYVQPEHNAQAEQEEQEALLKDDNQEQNTVEEEKKEDEKKPPQRKKFLKFERLTMIPIQKDLINQSLLTKVEMDWVDNYHKEVLEKVAPLLEPNSPESNWLVEACAPLVRAT